MYVAPSKELLDIIKDEINLSHDRLSDFRRKAHGFYRIVAGDYSQFGWTGQQRDRSNGADGEETTDERYEINVKSFPVGRVNHLKPILRQHIMASAIDFPDVTITRMSEPAKEIMSGYINARMSNRAHIGCNSAAELYRWVSDAAISGIGWLVGEFVMTHRGTLRQTTAYKSTIRCLWDTKTSSISNAKWFGYEDFRSAKEWDEILGGDIVLKELQVDPAAKPYTQIPLFRTFDLLGNEILWQIGTDGKVTKCLDARESWCFDDLGDGNPCYMLPASALYFAHQANVGIPTGIVEDCIAPLLGVWEAEDAIRAQIRAASPILLINKDMLEETILQNLKDSFTGTRIMPKVFTTKMKLQDGKIQDAFAMIFGASLDQGLMTQYENALQMLNKAGGANPYAYGAPEAGVDTATEANAINTESGTYQRSVARRVFATLSRVADLFIRMSRYDNDPLDLDVAGMTKRFGGLGEDVNRYEHLFDLDFETIVSENQDKFRDRAQRIAELENFLNLELSLQNIPAVNKIMDRLSDEMGFDQETMRVPIPDPAMMQAQQQQGMLPQQAQSA